MIHKLEKMCLQQEFDKDEATRIMKQLDVNQEFIPLEHSWKTVLLEWASIWANVSMVELLLKNGANPNIVFNDESTLWNLQYNDGETDEENENRLKIAQLLLEHGADPLIDPENTNECLYDYVMCSIFNDDFDELWEYRSRFFILLVAYGAKTKYCNPRVVGKFDKMNMQQYKFIMVPEGNDKYSGVIRDAQGNNVAFI